MKLVTFKENPHLGNMGHYGAVSYAFAIVQDPATSSDSRYEVTERVIWLYDEKGERKCELRRSLTVWTTP